MQLFCCQVSCQPRITDQAAMACAKLSFAVIKRSTTPYLCPSKPISSPSETHCNPRLRPYMELLTPKRTQCAFGGDGGICTHVRTVSCVLINQIYL